MLFSDHRASSVDLAVAQRVANRHRIELTTRIPMLPFGKGIGMETRRLYFALALKSGVLNPEPELMGASVMESRSLPVTRIFSFGQCNVHCPYCKRDCQFIGDNGLPMIAQDCTLLDLLSLAESAHARGETVRFSGGDPAMFPNATLAIAEYMMERYRAPVSIAHNGTGGDGKWLTALAPYLSSAAIDLKATPERIGEVMGISSATGERFYALSISAQRLLTRNRVLVDVRTPIFGDTSLDRMLHLAQDICQNDPRYTFWTWRLYKPVEGCDWQVPDKDDVFAMLSQVSSQFPDHWMGVRAKWEKGGMVYFRGGQIVNQEEAGLITDLERSGSGNHSLQVA